MRRPRDGAIVEAPARPAVEIIYAVHVLDYAPTRELFDRQQRKIATADAAIAQYRMLLRDALAQLEMIHTTAKTTSADYRKLVARSDTLLALSSVEVVI